MIPNPMRAHVEAVLATIAPEADLATVDAQALLREQLDLDSIDFQRLLAGMAERLGVDVPESDYPKCLTLEGLERYFGGRKMAP